MANRKFFSVILTMLLIFFIAFGSVGCGGGHSSNLAENEPNNPAPSPEPEPNPDPIPTPEPTIYTVTFDSNGGSSVPSQNIQSGKTATEPSTPFKEGFTFSGWYSDQSLTIIFNFTSLITSNVTLYAKWLPISKENYTVIFDSDGGSSVVQQIIKAGECATEPDTPTKSNYFFIGWYTKKEFSFMFDFNTPITGDITLYAKWYNENNTLDTDGDGLTDELELTIGTDPYSIDTDNDGLTDFEEINWLNYNPLVADTDGNGILDKDEDTDGDGLKNYEEKQHGTNMMLADSDYDGLSDYDEINVHHTSPTNPDTDGDEVDDGTEVSIGSDPNKANTTFTTKAEGGTSANDITISVSMKSTANGVDTLTVEHITAGNNHLISTMIPGFMDAAYEVTADSLSFESAIITFSLDSEVKESILEPTVYYLNDETGLLEEVENQRTEGNKVIAEVTHFSTYILLDKVEFDSVWDKTITPPASNEDSNGDKIPDYYAELMNSGRLVLSNGSAWLEGVLDVYGRDNADWDGDGLLNGEEIRVIEKDGQYYLYMNSDPLLYDTDSDGFSDYREAKVLNTSPMKRTLPRDLDMSMNLTQIINDTNFGDDTALKYLDFSKNGHWMQYVFDHNKTKEAKNAMMEYFSTCITAESLEKDAELEKRLKVLQTIKERITLAKSIVTFGKQATGIATSLYPDKPSDPEAEDLKDFLNAIQSQRESVALLSNILHQDMNNMNALSKAIETAGGIVFVSDYYNIVDNFKLLKEGASTIEEAMDSINKVTSAVKKKSSKADTWVTAGNKLLAVAKNVCTVNDKFLHLSLPVKGKFLKNFTKNMQTVVGKRVSTVLEIDDFGNITKIKKVKDVTRGDTIGMELSVVFDAMDTVTNLISTLDTYGKIKMNYVGFEESLETLQQISSTTSLPSYVRNAAQDLIKLFNDNNNVNWDKFNKEVIKASVGEITSGAFNIILDVAGFYFPVVGVVHGVASAVSTFGGLDERAKTIVAAQAYYSITDASRAILTPLIKSTGLSNHFIEFEDEDYAAVMKYIAQLAQSRVTGLETVENYIIAGKMAGWFERGSPIGILLDQKTQDSIVFGYQNTITRVYTIAKKFGITLLLTNNSTVTGNIYDYSTRTPIEAVLLQIRKGLKNISGDILTKTTTDSQGQYVLNFPANILKTEKNFTVELIKEGYDTTSFDLSVWGNLSKDYYMTKNRSSLSGIVRDISGDIPLESVKVRISSGDFESVTTMTNVNGQYSFSPGIIHNGTFVAELSKEDYKTSSYNITINGDTSQDFYMTQLVASSINGVIRDASGDVPLAGVTVTIISADGTTRGTTITNASGEYSFSLGKNGDGNYKISLSKTGYQSETIDITVVGATMGIDEYLRPVTMAIEAVPIDEEHFPDPGFRGYIRYVLDKDQNNVLSPSEIIAVKDVNVSVYGSLQGIEYFIYLETLQVRGSTTLDISNNVNLKYLVCDGSGLTTLDVSNNVDLESLDCSINQLTVLDVSNNIKLKYLDCSNNKLTTLDVSNNIDLQYLECYNNNLVTLNISNNSALKYLGCSHNQLSFLDVSNGHALESINCSINQLTVLDVSNNIKLKYLDCSNNKLTTLDVSNNTDLEHLACMNNHLTSLDLSNCHNLYFHSHLETNVFADSNVTIFFKTFLTETIFQNSYSSYVGDDILIVATLPEIKSFTQKEYSFDVLFDIEVPIGSTLSLVNSSEDLHGVFFNNAGEEITMPTTEPLTHVIVSAKFEPGQNYSPVIVARYEDKLQSGGCNAGAFRLMVILLSGLLVKKRSLNGLYVAWKYLKSMS